MIVRIYSLRDPRTDDVVYVGATTRSLQSRLHGHQRIKKILGATPVIELLEEVDEEDATDAERRWIIHMIREGHDLLNRLGGATRQYTTHRTQSPETRAKIAATRRERGLKPPSRKGRTNSPEHREALKAAWARRKGEV